MLEELRSEIEAGQIRVRVSSDEKFRRRVAESVVKEFHPGYCGGGYYADPVEGVVYYKEPTAAWSPWPDSIEWRIVGVRELVCQEGNDFSPEVDWNVQDIPYRRMVEGYLKDEGEMFEPNGDIPEWVQRCEVIGWARESDEFTGLIEEIERQSEELAIEFALTEILDEIVIEL